MDLTMAIGKQKRGKKDKRGGGGSAGGSRGSDFWVHLLRETVGKFAGQLMASGRRISLALRREQIEHDARKQLAS
jgi:hypothetical protein